MKKKRIIMAVRCVSLAIYILGYYLARKGHLLVRRPHYTCTDDADRQAFSIFPGNFGPGKGGILVSPNEILFCHFVFTPLRLLEA